MARLLDFGVAKGKGRLQVTRAGQLKGKVGYMSPEQILGEEPDRRSDVYAAAVVLWEVLTGERLFPSANTAGDNFSLIPKILELDIEPPSVVRATVPKSLDGIVMRGLNRARDARYDTARDFAVALEDAVQIATSRQIGEWVERMAADELAVRAELLNALERESHEVDKDSQSVVDTTVKRRRRKRLKERGRGDAPRVSDDATVEDAASASGRLAAPADEPSVDEPTREREATGDFRRTRMAGSEASAALADAAKRYREDDPASAIVRVKQAVVAPPHQDEVETVRNVDGDEDIPTAVATTLKSRVEALQRARLAEERGEHAEPETLVYARDQELKGPPGLPGHVTLKREAAAPSSEPVKSAPPSSLPEDMQLPVQSNRGVWLVLIAVVAVALAIALLARG
jgi:hypothetical protein